MSLKAVRNETKATQKFKSIRINLDNQKKAEEILNVANKKKAGRKVKLDQLLNIALDLVTEEHIKMLQERSMSNEDRKEQLRQSYIEKVGPISKDEFTGFMMTPDFLKFLGEYSLSA